MSGSASVLIDDSKLSYFDQTLFKLESALALVSGLAVFSLILIAVVSVVGRNFFDSPLPGYVDWIEQIMPLIAFMGVSYTQRLGAHIRMDLFVNKLPPKTLWITELITTAVILTITIILIYGTWHHFLRSFDFEAPLWSRDSSIDIGIPLWPAKLLVPIAFFVLSIRLCIQVWAYGRAIKEDSLSPVSVPLIEDVKTQAANEAAQVSDLSADNKRIG